VGFGVERIALVDPPRLREIVGRWHPATFAAGA
jgi:hypothetical protein